eukprot:Gb_20029 [translate_table: standard]
MAKSPSIQRRPEGVEDEIYRDSPYIKPPSIWRLAQLSSPEWLYALLGSIGVVVFESFNPVLAYVLVQIAEAYSRTHEMLRNDVGWFDEEENNVDSLSMRLANDATFVRAVFNNHLSILIQDTSSVIVALVIGIVLEWHLALAAFATLPFWQFQHFHVNCGLLSSQGTSTKCIKRPREHVLGTSDRALSMPLLHSMHVLMSLAMTPQCNEYMVTLRSQHHMAAALCLEGQPYVV